MRKGKKSIIIFAGAIILVLLFRWFVFSSYVIPSSGMENALYQGDHILVNKWSYGLRWPFMSLFSYHRWAYKQVKKGDIVVFNNPAVTQKAIDRRDIFICRCVGAPGDTLVVDSLFMIQSSLEAVGPDGKKLYAYPTEKEIVIKALLTQLSIPDTGLMGHDEKQNVRTFSRYEYYLLEQSLASNNWITPLEQTSGKVYTMVIPEKDKSIDIHPWNVTLLRNTIVLHEGKNADVRNDSLYISGQPVSSYTFSKDYYWMASNNFLNLSDSRLFGLVPHDHIIGKAKWVWFSKESDSGLFAGHRWERFFKTVK